MANSVDELTDGVLKNFENYNKDRLLDEFKNYPGIVIDETNAIEEMTELETKLRNGTIDDIELLRYDELKNMEDIYSHANYRNVDDIYNEFIQEVRANVKEGIQEYIKRLTALSQMHGFEIPFYYEFSEDVVNSMTNLGNNFEILFKFTTGGDLTSDYQTIFTGLGNQYITIGVNTQGYFDCNIGNGSKWLLTSNYTNATRVQPHTTYYMKVDYDGTRYSFKSSTDNVTWKEEQYLTSTNIIPAFTGIIGQARTLGSITAPAAI
jgi:hypothetical protein